jgi:uncharacterized membrane protein YsdA (DUF1294 family)
MTSRDPGVSRFNGCLFMFLAASVVSTIFPLVLFFFFYNGMGATVLFFVIPGLYAIFINVYCFLLVGRERNQESIEEEERLRTFAYFRPSGRRLFLWSLLGGALGTLIGRIVFKYQTHDKLFKWGLVFLLLLNVEGYVQVFGFLGMVSNQFIEEEKKQQQHEQWVNSKELANTLVQVINTYAKQKEKAINRRDPSLIKNVDWEAYDMEKLKLKIDDPELDPGLHIDIKGTKIYLDGKVNTTYDMEVLKEKFPEEFTVIVEMIQTFRDPSDKFDGDPVREINMYYDKEQQKWIIKGDKSVERSFQVADKVGKPVVTYFD